MANTLGACASSFAGPLLVGGVLYCFSTGFSICFSMMLFGVMREWPFIKALKLKFYITYRDG